MGCISAALIIAILPLILTLQTTNLMAIEPEARIYAGAPPGTAVTLSDAFAAKVDKHRGCHGRMTDGSGDVKKMLMWHMGRWNFVTKIQINDAVGTEHDLSIGFYCADGTLRTYDIVVKVSQRNSKAPSFESNTVDVYVPVDTMAGSTIKRLKATDADPVSYNHALQYSLVHSVEERYAVTWDGHLRMLKEMTNVRAFVRQQLQVRACDHGSPQLCATAIVNVYPATISAPTKVGVNTATREYQIIEWRHPTFGTPTKYRIYIRSYVGAHISEENPLYYSEVEYPESPGRSTVMRHMARVPLDARQQYSLTVSAVDEMGETPSRVVTMVVAEKLSSCAGHCHVEGGRPACFTTLARRTEERESNHSLTITQYDQYHDSELGPQCVCYDGFVGSQCAFVAECPPSLRTFEVGSLSWPATHVNDTIHATCAYGPKGNMVKRRCRWNRANTVPEWDAPDRFDLQNCRTKPELVTHLNVLQVVFFRGAVPNVAAMAELLSTLEMVLPNAILDPDIAQTMLSVLGAVQRADWQRIPMHTHKMQSAYRRVLLQYAQDAALNLQPTDIINMEDDIGVTSVAAVPNRRISLGRDAYIEFRAEHSKPRSFAVVWMKNSLFYPAVNYPHGDNSVIELIPTDQLISARSTDLSKYMKAETHKGRRLRHSSRDAIDLTADFVNIVENDHQLPPAIRRSVAKRERLSAPIRYAIRPSTPPLVNPYRRLDNNHTCVYYDEQSREWRTDGVYAVRQADEFGMVLCETWHLSAFSILRNSKFRRYTSELTSTYATPTLIACLLGFTLSVMVLIACAVFRYSHRKREPYFDYFSKGRLCVRSLSAVFNYG